MKSRFSKSLIAILIATVLMGVVALPESVKSKLPIGSWAKNQAVTLGLDLQGGTQLDYRIDLSRVEEKNTDDDPANDVAESDILEGVRSTIVRRVNNLGVSEPQIYFSTVGDEKHIIVELAGIKNVDEAKKVVGKTIQLEFKEQRGEGETDEAVQEIREEARETLELVLTSDDSFTEIGDRVRTADGKIDLREEKTLWDSELPAHYKNILPEMRAGQIYRKLIEGTEGFIVRGQGNIQEQKGVYITQLVQAETMERTTEEQDDFIEIARDVMDTQNVTLNDQGRDDFSEAAANAIWNTPEGEVSDIVQMGNEYFVYNVLRRTDDESEVEASHILISYEGAQRAADDVNRTKEEAQQEAERVLLEVVADPDSFGELAEEYSDGPSASKGGDLGFFGRGVMTPAFESEAFSMEVGDVSDVVETEFGFHIIKVTDKKAGEATADVEYMSADDRVTIEQALTRLEPYEVTRDEVQYTINEIFFDVTPDPWKPTGLDGAHFKYATVTYDQLGSPQVNIEFDSEGADLFEEITDRLTGKPLAIFVGGQLISAPNVNQKITGGSAVITGNYSLQEALQMANDLNTGAIDAPILLTGQYTISATLGQNALDISLIGGIIGLIAVALFMLLYYRLLGLFAVIALIIYAIIIIFILKIFPIVMTLAGIAGIILSIGMAVDANILIFERTREELKDGKAFGAAVTSGFNRAWPSIRDSNVSTLITCAILWFFGNSIIRGFALLLGIGVIISMFTAINVTRAFLKTLTGTKISKNRFLLGVKDVK